MSQAHERWNPVKKLQTIERSEIRADDIVIVRAKRRDPMSQDMDWQYHYYEYIPYMDFGGEVEFFLLERPLPQEPTGFGAVVEFSGGRAIRTGAKDFPWLIRDRVGGRTSMSTWKYLGDKQGLKIIIEGV